MYKNLSINNLKLVRSLKSNKGRIKSDLFVAEGFRLLSELSKKNLCDIKFVYGKELELDKLKNILHNVEMYLVENKFDNSIFYTENSQECAAVISIPNSGDIENIITEKPLFYLDEITDPGNMGNIFRSLDWFGFDSLILSENCVSPYNPKAVRASMGAVFRVKVYKDIGVKWLENSGKQILLLDIDFKNFLSEINLPQNAIYIIGNEAHGLSKSIKNLKHENVSIKGFGEMESLNAATTVSILCYELSKNYLKYSTSI
ncbi:MAG: RNA methyltransferase [Chlorobiota bacterium]|nr:RNA methyltransferase [Chlorobiota bacterium]QQS67650.1 MAG: RNA methyltransferase [Chlorobiota bacterium]